MFAMTPEVRARYEEDGFVVFRSVFATEVLGPLLDAVGESAFAVLDRHGNKQELNAWTWCGEDLVGRFPRCDPIVDLAEFLIGDAVYHWHSKISWKQPGSSGTWDWHQDYGFWIEEGCAAPAMATISVALDRNDTQNGCLHVIGGSHKLGVVEHRPRGHGLSANDDDVAAAVESMSVVPVELDVGDVVAFHCNLLHSSGSNQSLRPRSLLHCSYNAMSNAATAPLIDGHQKHEMVRVPTDALDPGSYECVFGLTDFIGVDNSGYGSRNGYAVVPVD
jgi:hypothetical protein